MTANQFDGLDGRLAAVSRPAGEVHVRPARPKRPEPVAWTLPGFVEGMRVTTSFGDLPIQALRRRDPLRTQAGTLATVEWLDLIRLDEGYLAENPDALPVRIPVGALGSGRPMRDLLVSPQQPVNASPSPYVTDFRLARDLTDRPGVVRQPMTMVSYHLFHCGAPATVLAEGVAVRVTP